MANYSLHELTNRMQGKSITLGWDAVVFMNRAKVNSLLEQQYITRFNKESFLKRISGEASVVPGDKEYLQLSGVILSHPRLNFAEASLRDSQVTATMDIVSGTVSYVRRGSNLVPGLVLNSFEVSAHQGYTVTMHIDLVGSKGTVSEQGEVVIDIGDAYDCRCNLLSNDNSQNMLGDFFKSLFMAQKPEDRVYTLGKLELRDVSLLAPRSFMIRTMATDEGKIRTSDDYGDGAVVLLVRTKGNRDEGDEPTENSLDYLIPSDRDEHGYAKYSGSLILASRVVFDWYIHSQIQRMIGNNLRLQRTSDSNHIARSLRAINGGFSLPGYYNKYLQTINESQYTETVGIQALNCFDPLEENALRVFADNNNELQVLWKGQHKTSFVTEYWHLVFPDNTWFTYGIVSPDIDFRFQPVVDPTTNIITFESLASFSAAVHSDPSGIKGDDADMQLPGWVYSEIAGSYAERAQEIGDIFKDSALVNSFGIPEINTLAISNLLFPERNALQLKEARLPGDLALFGQIDPKETTFTLDPLMPSVKAGETQKFTIRQLGVRTADVTWSVRSVDGTRATGTIVDGEFTAPEALLLEGSAVRNVVTASYTDQTTGKEVTASALVTVVLSGIVVTPSMSLIDMSNKQSVTLKATSLGAGPFTWTEQGGPGTLVPNGSEAVYTPPQTDLPEGTLQAVLFDVEDTGTGAKATATVLLRQGNFAMQMTPAFVPGMRPNGHAQLKTSGELQPDQFKWEIVAGQGEIDSTTGIFTAPAVITSPYSVVKVTHENEWLDTVGYSIIYLSEHAKQSTWLALDTFEFEVQPVRVWANGLQQARVVVRIKPAQIEDGPVPELSDAELESIRLVSADQKNPLPESGEAGVPEGGKWHYSETDYKYTRYPEELAVAQINRAGDSLSETVHTKEFFVSCHKVENLTVSASIMSDNYEQFYSNPTPADGEINNKAIKLVAFTPPSGGTIGQILFTFGEDAPRRVKGGENDVDLETIDYYFLKLVVKGVQVKIKKIEFNKNESMTKWESNTSLEDVHSITGYALPEKNAAGKQVLHIDSILLNYMDGVAPEPIVDPGYPVPDGEVLFSLHRRQFWQYDPFSKSEFEPALDVTVYDEFGNKHNVLIGFDGNDRNKLRIVS